MSRPVYVIQGPAGRTVARTSGEIHAALRRQRRKRDDVLRKAQIANVSAHAEEGEKIIKERTQAGEDYRRKPFGPYSRSYAEQKDVGQFNVDLTDSGKFLDNLIRKKIGDGRRWLLTFRSPQMRKRARGLARGKWPVYGKWTNMRRPKRRVMGFENQQDKERLWRRGYNAFREVFRRGMRHGR